MTYRVQPTPQAEADIERLFTSLVESRGGDVAREWSESYAEAVERLIKMPLSCGLAYENDWGTFDALYRTVFSPPFPTRAVVGASLRGILVEVSAIAYLGDG